MCIVQVYYIGWLNNILVSNIIGYNNILYTNFTYYHTSITIHGCTGSTRQHLKGLNKMENPQFSKPTTNGTYRYKKYNSYTYSTTNAQDTHKRTIPASVVSESGGCFTLHADCTRQRTTEIQKDTLQQCINLLNKCLAACSVQSHSYLDEPLPLSVLSLKPNILDIVT